MYLSVLLQFPLTALLLLLLFIIIIIKLFKGIHKRHVPVQGDTLTYNLYSYKMQLQKQNNILNTSIELTNHIKINCFNLDLKCLTWLQAKISSGIVFHKNATDTKKQ